MTRWAVTCNTDVGEFLVVVVNDFEAFHTGAPISDQEMIFRAVLILSV